jgi:uncharacterized membrane protein YccC
MNNKFFIIAYFYLSLFMGLMTIVAVITKNYQFATLFLIIYTFAAILENLYEIKKQIRLKNE